VRDAVVKFAGQRGDKLRHAVRVVTLEVAPHVKRSGHKGDAGPPSKGALLIATNLLDVPAEIIALLFRYRWQIEIFFRFFKCVLGCSHLLSHRSGGIEIQTYRALLACLLIGLWSGRKPTKRTHEMFCWYFLGLADEDDLARHVEKLKPHAS
jgi:IS4 transposase